MARGVVTEAKSGFYHVDTGDGVFICTLRGKAKRANLRKDGSKILADPVAVGDHVLVTILDETHGVIEDILPRQTKFSRRLPGKRSVEQIIVANADQLVITVSVQMPPLDFHFLDRFLVIAEYGKLESIICVNKCDLLTDEIRGEIEPRLGDYRKIGYRIIRTSVVTGEGIDELVEAIKGKFSVFVGASGVGKSSLLNSIQPGLGLRVKEVSSKTGKGRHTTTHVQRIALDVGGFVADTPGIRRLDFWRIDHRKIGSFYREIREVQEGCHYKDCSHLTEPGCKVIEAVESGIISAQRYESYKRLRAEATSVR